MRLRGTKADILKILDEQHSARFEIEAIHVFTVAQWSASPERTAGEIGERFGDAVVIVRSSAINEDTATSSLAGAFTSVGDVPAGDIERVCTAVETVIASYGKEGAEIHPENQVLVQIQTQDVVMSGVVFTRQLGNNAPYYVINYDDETGKTDTVTSGTHSRMVAVSRFVTPPYRPRWRALLEAVKEIEDLFPDQPLDIEFAIRRDSRVVIFQTRPLAANHDADTTDDDSIRGLLADMKAKFTRFTRRVPHLCGDTTVYSDMSDWNPAEIIGDRPNTLDYTLYRYIITDNIWHEARTSLGYFDVFPGELMTSFGRKPYIDVRLSFNSMIPATIPIEIREKLANYYLDKLARRPELVDKVEFEILWTCYDLSLEDRIGLLRDHGFSTEEIGVITAALKEFTLRIIRDVRGIFSADLESSRVLSERRMQSLSMLQHDDVTLWELLSAVHYILQNCRKHGTLPFSRLARLAFIGHTLLLSLKHVGAVDDEFCDTLLLSVETVAKRISADFDSCKNGTISHDDFLGRYGHLRAGTYDITSPRYDQRSDLLSFSSDEAPAADAGEHPGFELTAERHSAIERALADAGMDVEPTELLEFIVKALEYRELSKFEFTKSLSDAIELLSLAGRKLGLTREELCHVDFRLLMRYRNPEVSDIEYVKDRIHHSMDRHRTEKQWYSKLILPPVIATVEDFDYIEYYAARPNFITSKKLRAQTVFIGRDSSGNPANIENRIAIIENADPGYDWIFTRKPAGLITKYGGVASHMAIRCAEFGLPAAIGCGEVIFSRLSEHAVVVLNCRDRKIEYL